MKVNIFLERSELRVGRAIYPLMRPRKISPWFCSFEYGVPKLHVCGKIISCHKTPLQLHSNNVWMRGGAW